MCIRDRIKFYFDEDAVRVCSLRMRTSTAECRPNAPLMTSRRPRLALQRSADGLSPASAGTRRFAGFSSSCSSNSMSAGVLDASDQVRLIAVRTRPRSPSAASDSPSNALASARPMATGGWTFRVVGIFPVVGSFEPEYSSYAHQPNRLGSS